MRLASWAGCLVGLALWALPARSDDRPEPLYHITSVDMAVEQLDSATTASRALQVPAGLQWHRVTLPRTEVRKAVLGALHSRVRLWVRLPADAMAVASTSRQAVAYSAYMYASDHVTLYADGLPVAATDDTLSNDWNLPVMLALPLYRETQAGAVLLSFECHVTTMGCGVPSFRLGSLAAVNSWFSLQQFWRVDGPRIGSMAMLTVGAFALLFWLRQRSQQPYLLFTLAAVLWTLRTLHYHLPHYPRPELLFWWVTDSALNWLSVTVYLFAFRLREERRPRTERALLWAALVLTILNLPPGADSYWIQDVIVNTGQSLISVLITGLLTVAALRTRAAEQFALAAALWISLAFGVHDALLQTSSIDIEQCFWLPYGALPILGAFIFALARRYGEALETSAALNASLEQRLASRQRELQFSYEQLRGYERERAQSDERQRLMRDIHDGLGATLISTLASVERGSFDRDATIAVLREAVDDLRLMIDSLEPLGQDLVMLLATLRYRLGPRLDRLGLEMEWRMAELPSLPWLDSHSTLHILRIVQESITNIIKHAGARHIRIETRVNGAISLVIADDGVGFDPQQQAGGPGGRGLANLQHRAAQIGATLDIASGPSGTCVTVVLPLTRADAPGAGS